MFGKKKVEPKELQQPSNRVGDIMIAYSLMSTTYGYLIKSFAHEGDEIIYYATLVDRRTGIQVGEITPIAERHLFSPQPLPELEPELDTEPVPQPPRAMIMVQIPLAKLNALSPLTFGDTVNELEDMLNAGYAIIHTHTESRRTTFFLK